MVRSFIFVIYLVCFLGGILSCGEDERFDFGKIVPIALGGGTYQGDVGKYLGTYTSSCFEIDQEKSISAILQVKIEQNTLTVITGAYVHPEEDISCEDTNLLFVEETVNDLKIVGEHKGGNIVKTIYSSYYVTLMNEVFVNSYNSQSKYGYNDWELETPKDLTQEEKQNIINKGDSFIDYMTVKRVEDTLYVGNYNSQDGEENPDPETDPKMVLSLVQEKEGQP